MAHAFLALQMLKGVNGGVIRSSLNSQKRTHDILCATEERIAALKAELAESEHHVVGLSKGEIFYTLASSHHHALHGTYAICTTVSGPQCMFLQIGT